MSLTQREREIVDALRADPMLDAAAIAARLGATKAAVAVHLSNLSKKGVILGRGYVVRPQARSVVVVGGANMDLRAQSARPAALRTSNPGHAVTTPGGVGRNIAENLARLGTPTHLVAPVGRDEFGEQVVARTRSAGVLVDHLLPTAEPTGTYLAVLDSTGELVVAVANMAATERLTPTDLLPARDLVANAELVVLDGNLPADAAGWLLDEAARSSVRVVVDPVSVRKAGQLADALSTERPVLAVTPNTDELAAMVGAPVRDNRRELAAAARVLHARGVRQVWVRRGTRGSLLSTVGDDGRTQVDALAAPQVDAVDVTGAGDAMSAAFVHALLRGDSPLDAARFGQVAAALTVASPETVRTDLTAALVDAALHDPTRLARKEQP